MLALVLPFFFLAPDSSWLWLTILVPQAWPSRFRAPQPVCLLSPGPLWLSGALRLCALVFCRARLCPLFPSQPRLAAIRFGSCRRSSRPWHGWKIRSLKPPAPYSTLSPCAQHQCLRSPHGHARSRSPTPLPKRAPARRGSLPIREGGLATGLAVKCCPPAPAGCTRLSRVRPERVSGISGTSETCSCSHHAHAERS